MTHWTRVMNFVPEPLSFNCSSGSSFLGNLLAAADNARYLFEPLYPIERKLIKEEMGIPSSKKMQVKAVLEGVFGCVKVSTRNPEDGC